MHNLLWGLSDLTDADIAAQNLEGVTLRSYLARRGVKETMIEMACAGYANTVAGTVDNVGVRNAVRMDRTWWQDGGHDMSLLPSVSRVRSVAVVDAAVPPRIASPRPQPRRHHRSCTASSQHCPLCMMSCVRVSVAGVVSGCYFSSCTCRLALPLRSWSICRRTCGYC